ncbi:MAG: preprotein translocase subunit SecY [Bacteroidetes bacterium]|nr:preprotein translocase subunit SecY [Bacteroidota bacterium]
MSKFTDGIVNAFKIQELRDRILYTLGMVVVFRIGSHITLPGIDGSLIAHQNNGAANDLFGLFDMFVGGAFSRASILALGIMPYISASIIIQLMGAVVPTIQKMQKEGEEGRKKITQWTRYGTVIIAALQAWGMSVQLTSRTGIGGSSIVVDPGVLFTVSTVVLLTAGTVFAMWIGERITDRGIGNGISLLIFVGIVARMPVNIYNEFQIIGSGGQNLLIEIIMVVLLVFITAGVIAMTQGTRKIPVQYAKRVVGKRTYGGVTQFIPLKINTAGVMPIIFAQSIMFIPSTIISFFPENEAFQTMAVYFQHDGLVYNAAFALMIIFFTYFYTAIAFNPTDVAENMKKQGGFIPGIRPGTHTSEFIDGILSRITLPGSIILALIAILPAIVIQFNVTPGFAQFFGGTSLLIMVGVALDTLKQIESHLLMRHYDGLMKSGRMRGRK